jgi:hypothetical protein
MIDATGPSLLVGCSSVQPPPAPLQQLTVETSHGSQWPNTSQRRRHCRRARAALSISTPAARNGGGPSGLGQRILLNEAQPSSSLAQRSNTFASNERTVNRV